METLTLILKNINIHNNYKKDSNVHMKLKIEEQLLGHIQTVAQIIKSVQHIIANSQIHNRNDYVKANRTQLLLYVQGAAWAQSSLCSCCIMAQAQITNFTCFPFNSQQQMQRFSRIIFRLEM